MRIRCCCCTAPGEPPGGGPTVSRQFARRTHNPTRYRYITAVSQQNPSAGALRNNFTDDHRMAGLVPPGIWQASCPPAAPVRTGERPLERRPPRHGADGRVVLQLRRRSTLGRGPRGDVHLRPVPSTSDRSPPTETNPLHQKSLTST